MLFNTQIVAHRTVANGTHEVTFKRPAGFEFKAGQYTQVAVSKLIAPDPKGRSRQFSLASPPEDRKHLRVVFRASGSGFKKTLMSIPKNSTVTIEQASGSFLFPDEVNKSHVFVAGGVGIAPFMSYLPQQREKTLHHPLTLYYGNKDSHSAAYLAELEQLSEEQQQFSIHNLYHQPSPDLFSDLVEKHPNAVWWIVGPPAMVAVVISGLRTGGVLSDHIFTESFEGY
ncbi:hypothetical protein CL652_03095 [bacterium]|nr:hypothetical protein [bacterium]|tara:strand:- start:51851 stop:52531 length:681 start_codon:yes stop_codon:yes gene_type:complete